jgi:hypothetical protein
MDTWELADLQDDLAAALLPDTCTILAVTYASDGQGGQTETWGTAAASVACRLDALRGFEGQAGAAVQPFHAWVITLPANTTITPANRIVHGGATYSVTSVDGAKSWEACVRAYVEAI